MPGGLNPRVSRCPQRSPAWPSVKRLRRYFRTVLGSLLLVLAPCLPAQQPGQSSGASRVVVVGDVHGAYDELVRLLQVTGVVDESLAWIGGETRLVSLGDLLDRGSDSRKVMDLLKGLQRDAPSQGGAVHVVLGNHELMNLLGDLRYVSAEEYAAFIGDESNEVREAAYTQFAARLPAALPEEEARAAFEARYPPGYFGHRVAFRPDGEYGSWLLSLPAILRLDDVVFVHGGLPELVARTSPESLNRRVQALLRRHFSLREQLVGAGVLPPWDTEDDLELAQTALAATGQRAPGGDAGPAVLLEEFIALQAAPELGLQGPLWYRGAAYCNAFLEKSVLDGALASLGAARVVVGHTVTEDRKVHELFDGRLIMLDTGMLAEYYSGRPAALILDEGRTVVHYLNPEEQSSPEPGRIEAYALTEAQIVGALAHGSIEPAPVAPATAAPQRVRVQHEGRVLEAIFLPHDQGVANSELAAHGLDRLLGLGLVPPTVARTFAGRDGALQLQYPNGIVETQRLRDGSLLQEWCSIPPQINLMTAFDFLIDLRRTTDGVVIRPEFPTVKLIDHARAFSTRPEGPALPAGFAPSPGLAEALAELDRVAIEAALGAWIDSAEIQALLERRDALLAHAALR